MNPAAAGASHKRGKRKPGANAGVNQIPHQARLCFVYHDCVAALAASGCGEDRDR